MKKMLAILLAAMMLLSLVHAVADSPVEITILPLASKVTVQAETEILYPQEGYNTVRLTAEIEPADAARRVTWKSSNEKVATVDAEGVVTAVGGGTA
ncbi:MAG: Ig-like domain-containing protein, partial [Clostridia bacterium]|nr:Ig-like domain-containing protein [Clostridia bacterium]